MNTQALDFEPLRLVERALERVTRPLALGALGARAGLYAIESIPLLALQRFLGASYEPTKRPGREAQQAVLEALRELMERDAENMARGVYPLSVLAPTHSPLTHVGRYLQLLYDSVGVAQRRKQRRPREFAGRAAAYAEEVPDYYRRNFHFQTDGYLSEHSAELYEHQVEILFRGVADAMRRAAIPPLKDHFGDSDGRGLQLLEVAAGCGTATRFVAQAFPAARITCIDLSPPYLRAARKRLRGFERVEFIRGDATDLDLRSDRYDAAYSVFLFHELPRRERERVLAEAHRVVRPGGVQVVVDALQTGDIPNLDWTLEEFPERFHEPFFRDYTRHPLEDAVRAAGFASVQTDTAFLSKVVRGVVTNSDSLEAHAEAQAEEHR